MRLIARLTMVIVIAVAWAADSSDWLDVPYVRQAKEGCGSAAMSMIMRYWIRLGATVDEKSTDAEHIQALLHDASAKGIYGSAMAEYLRKNSFSVYVISGDSDDIRNHVSQGRPMIVCLKPDSSKPILHYVVVVGVDSARNRVIIHDPTLGAFRSYSEQRFNEAWRATNNWALLAVPALP